MALASRNFRNNEFQNMKIVFGSEPLINYLYFSKALRENGISAHTLVSYVYRISSNSDFDKVINPQISSGYQGMKLKSLALLATSDLRKIYHFVRVIVSNDVVVFSCNGFLLSEIGVGLFNYRFERFVYRVASIKCVAIPYGADAYVYRRLNDMSTYFALNSSYPQNSRNQRSIARQVDFWVDEADIFIASGMQLDGFGRSDIVTPNLICIDSNATPQKKVRFDSNGPICITHAPNHRGAKGTKEIINVVEQLANDGYPVTLRLLENLSNAEVLHVMATESDIHIDQILMNGYGLNAIEAMAIGLPVVGHLSETYADFFSRFSFLKECPIQSANPETIYELLVKLIRDDDLRTELGLRGREYVARFHSYKKFVDDFSMLF